MLKGGTKCSNIWGYTMNAESIKKDILVPVVAKGLQIAAVAKPTKDELVVCAKITSRVAMLTAIGCLVVQAVLRNK